MAGQMSKVAARVWFHKVTDSIGLHSEIRPSQPYTARWQSRALLLSLTSCKPEGWDCKEEVWQAGTEGVATGQVRSAAHQALQFGICFRL